MGSYDVPEEFLKVISSFSFAVFRVTIKAEEPLELPYYKGSAIRGVFGHSLRKVICPLHNQECKDCSLREKCVYTNVFEVYRSDDMLLKKHGITNPPRPYIIRPPLESKQYYKVGEELTFNMVLIGEKTIMTLPYLIYAFMETGKRGIGKGRRKFIVKNADYVGLDGVAKTIFSHPNQTLDSNFTLLSGASFMSCNHNIESCSLQFLTPLQIKVKKKYIGNVNFGILFHRLLQRIIVLSHLYCDVDCSELSKDTFTELCSMASNVVTHDSSFRWCQINRYSNRQQQRTPLSGITGKVTFSGNLKPFWPFIMLGSHIHVGRETTFGLGHYDIR